MIIIKNIRNKLSLWPDLERLFVIGATVGSGQFGHNVFYGHPVGEIPLLLVSGPWRSHTRSWLSNSCQAAWQAVVHSWLLVVVEQSLQE